MTAISGGSHVETHQQMHIYWMEIHTRSVLPVFSSSKMDLFYGSRMDLSIHHLSNQESVLSWIIMDLEWIIHHLFYLFFPCVAGGFYQQHGEEI